MAAGLTPVPPQQVAIEDAFWSPKLTLWQAKTLHDVFDKFEKGGAFRNFDRVAAGEKGGHKGEPWWDGLVYETITGAADFMASNPDPELRKRIAGLVARIAAAAAKDPDGYVNTGVTLDGIGHKWSNAPAQGDDLNDVFPHTVYNAGCLVEAGVHLYRATGDTELLKVATRVANYLCSLAGPPPKLNIMPGHALSELAFVELYQLYREQPDLKQKVGLPVDEQAYMKLAEFWIDNRGNTKGRAATGTYNQDDQPVFTQRSMEGHAVRSALLAAGVAYAGSVNGRQDYRDTAVRWWDNMVEAKMYVTGGLGAIPSIEGFGPDYELPNQGYAETCASVAAGFFSSNLNLLTGDAKYIDVLERELYNGALSGISLEGDNYFYTNFLSAGPDHRRWAWKSGAVNITPCCPPMFLKLKGAVPGYVYARDEKGICVNLYIGSTVKTEAAGVPVELKQTTDYPWEGVVNLEVKPQKPASFRLRLRVPGWAKGAEVKVNGETFAAKIEDHYLGLEREWKQGDRVTLNLPMPVERVKADPRVKANLGRVALMRGPLVYCMEGVDNGGRVSSLLLPVTAQVTSEEKKDLLGGVTVLKGEAVRTRRDGAKISTEPVSFTAIPFYANSNREPTDMEVWIADDPAQVRAITPASEAEASASHCFGSDTVLALNDGLEPSRSDDESLPRMTWWDHRGTQEWAQLTFAKPRTLSGSELYWWDESRIGRQCRVPESWTLEYLDGSEWKPVTGTSDYGTRMDAFNAVRFQPVTTTALRVKVKLQNGWSGGILEWRVNEAATTSN